MVGVKMKEPKVPLRTGKFISLPKYNENFLKCTIYVHPDILSNYGKKWFEKNWTDQYEEETSIIPKIKEWWYDTEIFTLQQLLDIIPKEANPKNITIIVNRTREINHITVSVIHRTPIDEVAWKAGELAEDKKYKEELAIYEVEKVKYDEWYLENQIKELQNKLEQLRK